MRTAKFRPLLVGKQTAEAPAHSAQRAGLGVSVHSPLLGVAGRFDRSADDACLPRLAAARLAHYAGRLIEWVRLLDIDMRRRIASRIRNVGTSARQGKALVIDELDTFGGLCSSDPNDDLILAETLTLEP